MKDQKTVRHEVMNEVRSELKSQMGRRVCIDVLVNGNAGENREMYLQVLQKKGYILGLEDEYAKLARVIRVKENRSAQEDKFVEFAQKNQLM